MDQLPLHARPAPPVNGTARQIGRHKREVSWPLFEPLLLRLRHLMGDVSQAVALEQVGYSGQGNVAVWRDAGAVPLVCYNAIQWVLQMNDRPSEQPFSDVELIDLLLMLRGREIPEEARRELLRKIAGLLGNV